MSERPSFIALYLQFARMLALRSTCRRLKVGAVLTTTDFRKVVSLGYNGNARGLPNDCDSDEPGKCGCLHAEENAVIKCDVPMEVQKYAFCTHQPCVLCAKRLINMGGLTKLYFIEPYRSPACDLLIQSGVECIHVPKVPVQTHLEVDGVSLSDADRERLCELLRKERAEETERIREVERARFDP